MKIIAIDSTAKIAAVALTEDTRLLSELTQNAGNTHSESLLPAVESLLSAFSLTPREVGLYAVTRGPGSFTGVRIGVATVKGLAYTDRGEEPIPTVGVSAIEALAYNFEGLELENSIFVPVMDARRSQVYTAIFSLEGGKPHRLTEDAALSLDELCALLKTESGGRKIYFTGDGYSVAERYFASRSDGLNLGVTPEALRYQRGLAVAHCGYDAYLRGEAIPAKELSPTYLRLPQAERERLERENNNN